MSDEHNPKRERPDEPGHLPTVPPSAPATTPGPIEFKKILCPIDYSPSALKALEYALELGWQADGCVTVLSALEYMDPEEPCEHVDLDIRRNRQHFIDHARERLHAQLAGEPQTWCAIEEIVAINRAYKGNPAASRLGGHGSHRHGRSTIRRRLGHGRNRGRVRQGRRLGLSTEQVSVWGFSTSPLGMGPRATLNLALGCARSE